MFPRFNCPNNVQHTEELCGPTCGGAQGIERSQASFDQTLELLVNRKTRHDEWIWSIRANEYRHATLMMTCFIEFVLRALIWAAIVADCRTSDAGRLRLLCRLA